MIIASWLVVVAVIGTWMPARRRLDPRVHDLVVAVVMLAFSFLNAGMNVRELIVSSVCGTIGSLCGWRALRGTST